MRLFLAVPLEEEVREAVYRNLEECRKVFPGLTWVKPEAMHITLIFLGELPEPTVRELKDNLESLDLTGGPFTLTLDGFGTFPPTGPPRVVYWRVRKGEERLVALYRICAGGLGAFLPPDARKPFRPHLTIARVRSMPPGGVGVTEALPFIHRTSVVDRLVLYRSILRSRGPEYIEEWVRFFPETLPFPGDM